MSTLPTWAIFCVSFGTPITAFLGVFLGHILLRKGANELDRRAKREELGRTLRWAAEQAVKSDDLRANGLGMAVLTALEEADRTLHNLQPEDKLLLPSVVEAIAGPAAQAYRELAARGAQPEVVIDNGTDHGVGDDDAAEEDSEDA